MDLARGVVLDETWGDYPRTVALQALDACGDQEGLLATARWIKNASNCTSTRLAANFSRILFPRYLVVEELIELIERSPSLRRGALEGFGDAIDDLWRNCSDAISRERLLAGIADLCLAPPFEDDYRRISRRHHEIARNLAPIAREAMLRLGSTATSEGLVRVLMAVERADYQLSGDESEPSLNALVSGNTQLKRQLFWADVEDGRYNERRNNDLIRPWQVHSLERRLWQLGREDLVWLVEDLAERPPGADRRIALSAMVAILKDTGEFDVEVLRLRRLVANDSELEQDLAGYLTPPPENEENRRFHLRERRNQRAQKKEERNNQAAWIRFRERLRANPSQLCDTNERVFGLRNLSIWLRHKTQEGYTEAALQAPVRQILFEVITGRAPGSLGTLNRGLRVLQRLDLGEGQLRRITMLALRRLRAAQAKDKDGCVQRYLAMLFLADADRAARELADWFSNASRALGYARAEDTLGTLFGRSNTPLVTNDLSSASVSSLEQLVRIAYHYVRPEDDRVREGSFTPDARDSAEEARNTLLRALLDRTGVDAYRAMRRLAGDKTFPGSAIRFNELARAKAEHDAELPAWKPKEVLAFERHHIAPAKTGEALLRVVMGVLTDIQSSFDQADATSRPLLERAENEDEVQKWLAEQIIQRARDRFHVHRESQVARDDKPDIIVSSTSAPVQVAIEVKHGGMNWAVRDYERALISQLTETYLKPVTRRCGVLVISHHGQRTWRDPINKATLNFHQLIERLQTLVKTVTRNKSGAVEVRVFGIDTSPSCSQ